VAISYAPLAKIELEIKKAPASRGFFHSQIIYAGNSFAGKNLAISPLAARI
jgi:hypothetical protein